MLIIPNVGYEVFFPCSGSDIKAEPILASNIPITGIEGLTCRGLALLLEVALMTAVYILSNPSDQGMDAVTRYEESVKFIQITDCYQVSVIKR